MLGGEKEKKEVTSRWWHFFLDCFYFNWHSFSRPSRPLLSSFIQPLFDYCSRHFICKLKMYCICVLSLRNLLLATDKMNMIINSFLNCKISDGQKLAYKYGTHSSIVSKWKRKQCVFWRWKTTAGYLNIWL